MNPMFMGTSNFSRFHFNITIKFSSTPLCIKCASIAATSEDPTIADKLTKDHKCQSTLRYATNTAVSSRYEPRNPLLHYAVTLHHNSQVWSRLYAIVFTGKNSTMYLVSVTGLREHRTCSSPLNVFGDYLCFRQNPSRF